MGANIPNTPVSLLKKLTHENASDPHWERFITLYAPVIRAWLICKDIPESDLDDVQQTVFIKLIKQLRGESYDKARGEFRKYLYCIVNSTSIDHFRKRQAQRNRLLNGNPQLIETHPDDLVPIPFQVDVQFELARMKAAIDTLLRDPKLTPIQREVLEKCILHETSPATLVDTTGVSLQHLYRIQKKLYKLIQKHMKLWDI